MNKKYLYTLPSVIYASTIFYLSSLSSPTIPSHKFFKYLYKFYLTLKSMGIEYIAYPFYVVYKYPDKFEHFILYFGFGLTLYFAFKNLNKTKNYSYIFAIVAGVLYAALDEFHQSFVPLRSSSLFDLIADAVGIFFAQITVLLLINIKNFISKSKGVEE